MKNSVKENAFDFVNETTLKKVILAGIALFVLNLLVGLATAKADAPNTASIMQDQTARN